MSVPSAVVLFTLLASAAWFDLKSHRIPNWLNVTGIGVGLVLGAIDSLVPQLISTSDWWSALTLTEAITGLTLTGLLPLIIYIAGSGGAADVKLAWVMGVYLGWRGGCLAVWSAYLLAGLWGLSALVLTGRIWRLTGLYFRTGGHRLFPRRFVAPAAEEWNAYSDAYPMAPFYLAGGLLVMWARLRGVD